MMSIPFYRKRTTPLILQQWVSQRRTTPYFWTRPWVTKYCTVIFLRLACSHVRARSVLTDARVASIIREAHTSTLPSTHAGDCGGRSLLAYLEMGHPRALWFSLATATQGLRSPALTRVLDLCSHNASCVGRVFNPRNASRQHTRARLTIHPRRRCSVLLQADHDPQRSTWPRWR